ncbi:MAG: hypothetical protein ACFFAU_18220 [Candidatus Hodarchaeota archaeon]
MDLVAREIKLEKEISWKMKEEIGTNYEIKNFYDYLKKEKELFDKPRPIKQLSFVGIGLTILVLFLIYESFLFLDFFYDFLENNPIGPEELHSMEFSLLMVVTTLATILGLIFSITFIIFKYLLTTAHWSRFHDQTLALIGRLDEERILENYITFKRNDKTSSFLMNKISIDFQIQWLFPFIFDAFPPLLLEISLLSFLLPFSVSTSVSLLIYYISFDLVLLIISCGLMIAIIYGFYTSISGISRSWRKYIWIRNLMIDRQQEIIHKLILQQADSLEILMNEQNLTRLEKMHPFPLPAIVRLSAIIPLLGSFIGYLIGLLIIK